MTWKDIKLSQYQKIYPIITDESLTELDQLVMSISELTGKSVDEIDGWPIKDINAFSFLFRMDFDSKPPKYIEANGRKYKFNWEIEKMPAARYIESKTFLQDGFVQSLHKIMACCVLPMKKTWRGWVVDKYNAADHSKYAEDMKDMRFVDMYNCSVFFCNLFGKWIESLGDYLAKDQNLTSQQREHLKATLSLISDGYTTLVR